MNIYTYTDYRVYLGDFLAHAKETIPHFSLRYFSGKVGIKAPNFLPWLISGRRNLSLSTAPKVCAAMKLSPDESAYFLTMVRFNQAKTLREKTAHFNRLTELRKPFAIPSLTEAQFEHYRSWYHKAIRELLHFYPFRPQEKYAYRHLAKKLAPAITESQARQAIQQLLALGLLEKDGQGCLRPNETAITTGDEVNSFLIRKYHEAMIGMAGESLDRFPREVRDVSSLTMSISPEAFALIKQEIQIFRKKLMDLIQVDKKPAHVYQLNFQFFPMTAVTKPDSDDEVSE